MSERMDSSETIEMLKGADSEYRLDYAGTAR